MIFCLFTIKAGLNKERQGTCMMISDLNYSGFALIHNGMNENQA